MNLVIDRLSKTYANGVRALNNVSLEIPAGMFGLLGPNGAGKSTLMRTIATLQQPDCGSDPPRRHRRPHPARRRPEDPRLPAAGIRLLSEPERRARARSLRGAQGRRERGRAARARARAAQADQSLGGAEESGRRILRRHEAATRHRDRARRPTEAAHRRRADGGPRSERAPSLSQPAVARSATT